MIAFPEMLVECGKQAGMKVPEDDCENFDANQFPHWYVYMTLQIGRPMPHAGVHWENAKVVADIPEDKIREVTYDDLLDLGFV